MAGTHPFARKRISPDVTVHDANSQFQNVATGRVLDLRGGVRIGHVSGIAGILEVVEYLCGVHDKYSNAWTQIG